MAKCDNNKMSTEFFMINSKMIESESEMGNLSQARGPGLQKMSCGLFAGLRYKFSSMTF